MNRQNIHLFSLLRDLFLRRLLGLCDLQNMGTACKFWKKGPPDNGLPCRTTINFMLACFSSHGRDLTQLPFLATLT